MKKRGMKFIPPPPHTPTPKKKKKEKRKKDREKLLKKKKKNYPEKVTFFFFFFWETRKSNIAHGRTCPNVTLSVATHPSKHYPIFNIPWEKAFIFMICLLFPRSLTCFLTCQPFSQGTTLDRHLVRCECLSLLSSNLKFVV